jgi:sigma-54 dependent transcriptional regulator, acetoin dehydrogenase operon transcriptional activator AcoR
VLSYDDLLADATVVWQLDLHSPPITIGRAYDSDPVGFRSPSELRLPDRWMSAGHAIIVSRRDGYVLADCSSRNGTWLNGLRITEAPLQDGDLIEVGHSLFCYRDVPLSVALALEQPPEALAFGPGRTVCPEMAVLLRDLARIAPSRESVLVLGDTGVGKELVAQTIHRLSGRTGRLGVVDCGAVPETLFEATFFGHRRGAFTGAADARIGEIARAHGGTLFLDEVGNMTAAMQAKLLRVIEDGRVTPLGEAEPQTVDVRWIAATNRDLFADESGFRPDLLRRLASFVARVPPLRRRREDLGILTACLLREAHVSHAAIRTAAGRRLFGGELPGNVRQLRTVLRSAILLAAGEAIDVAHLPATDGEAEEGPAASVDAVLAPQASSAASPSASAPQASSAASPSAPAPQASSAASPSAPAPQASSSASRSAPAREQIEAVLEANGGNVVRAAEALGTSARQLYRWIERAGISLQRFRE